MISDPETHIVQKVCLDFIFWTESAMGLYQVGLQDIDRHPGLGGGGSYSVILHCFFSGRVYSKCCTIKNAGSENPWSNWGIKGFAQGSNGDTTLQAWDLNH